ncbi:diguanylate cyclase [Desulfovibrio aminophilus]|uniref:GGDEF domain-containing protein n=1 Tax=Desulfovibrio aminophilus TaxID=81425 RepID=UPI003397642A
MQRTRPAVFYGLTLLGLALLFALGFMGYYDLILKNKAETAAWAAQAGLIVVGGGLLLLVLQAMIVFRAFIGPLARDEERLDELDEAVRRLTITDELTHVYNRAKLEECVLREIEHARRYKAKAAALMLDVDGMGDINRTQGDRAGDHLLADLARLLTRRVRKNDLVFRWRGDTFAVLAPHIDGPQAERFARKLRAEIAATEFQDGLRVSVSVSAAQIEAGDTPDTFLLRLREGLEQATAKRNEAGKGFEPAGDSGAVPA